MLKIKLTKIFKENFKSEYEIEIYKCDDEKLNRILSKTKNELIFNEFVEFKSRIDIDLSNENYIYEIERGNKKLELNFEIDNQLAKKLLKDIIESFKIKEERKGKSKEEIFKMQLKKAKKTGEEQFYYKYNDYCNEPSAQCDLDLINVYIKPNGTLREERIHTY